MRSMPFMVERRSCTDIPSLVIFICVVIIWLALGIYSFTVGWPGILTSPKDSVGSRCGIDSHVIEKPLLFYFDILDCDLQSVAHFYCQSPSICVESCPTTTFFSSKDSKTKKLYCFYGIDSFDNKKCAKWYVPSVVYKQRCIPRSINIDTLKQINEERNQSITLGKFQNVIKRAKFMELFRYYGHHAIYNIIRSWWKFFFTALVTGIICVMYVFLLGLAPTVMFLLSTICVSILLCFGIYVSTRKYGIFSGQESDKSNLFADYDSTIWYIAIIILSILLFCICITLCLENLSMSKTLKVTKACGKILQSNIDLLILPFLTWIPKILVVTFGVAVSIFLETSGKAIYIFKYITPDCRHFIKKHLGIVATHENQRCYPEAFQNMLSKDENNTCLGATCNFVTVDQPGSHVYINIYIGLVAFWLIGFFHDLGVMILTHAVARWYWTRFDTRRISIVEALIVLKYNLGTVVFGSFIIPFCSNFLMKMIMQTLGKEITQDRFAPRMCLMECINISLTCVQKATVLISRNGYILCAIKGENYIKSAKHAQNLLSRNRRTYVPPNIDFMIFVGKLLLTLATGIISYRIFTWELNFLHDSRSLHVFLSVFLLMSCTYITCKSFFSIYETSIDSAYFCFLVEKDERHDTVDVYSTEQFFEEYFVI